MASLRTSRQWLAYQLHRPGSMGRRYFSITSKRDEAFGFIGLGRMGYPMAKNLRAKISEEDTLTVYDVNAEATEKFVEEMKDSSSSVIAGNTLAGKDARQVVEKSDTIITSLPEPSHMKSLIASVTSPGPLPPNPSHPSKDRLIIDTSTIDPITSTSLSRTLSSLTPPVSFIDSPMSGGVVGSKAGTLTFMLGCPTPLLPRATTILQKMGRRILHLGETPGAGLCGKLANNYLLAINNIATAEAMRMGMAWGLDGKKLAGMINGSTGRCWPSEFNNPVPGVLEYEEDGVLKKREVPADRDYEGGFGVSLMSKDLGLAMSSAREFGVTPRLGGKAAKIYGRAMEDEKCKGKDFSSIYLWLCEGGKGGEEGEEEREGNKNYVEENKFSFRKQYHPMIMKVPEKKSEDR